MSSWIFLQIAHVSGFTTQGFDRPMGLSSETSFVVLLSTILNWFLGFVGTFAFLILVWAGFSYMTSRGVGDKVKKAKTTMIYALTGIIIILLAYAAIFTITHYLATGQMTEDPSAGSTVPAAVEVSPRSGVVTVNPSSLGVPGSGQVPMAVPVDTRFIQVNPSSIGIVNPRTGVPVGDGTH